MGVLGLHATSRGASGGRMQNPEKPDTQSVFSCRRTRRGAARLEAGLILASLPCYNCSRCKKLDVSVRQRTHSSTAQCLQSK